MRLNERNRVKKALANRIIREMTKIVNPPFSAAYKLAKTSVQRNRNLDDLRNKMIENRMNSSEYRSKFNELWLDFTSTTSFKSKANSIESSGTN